MDEAEYLPPPPSNADRLKYSLEQVKNKVVQEYELFEIDDKNQSPE